MTNEEICAHLEEIEVYFACCLHNAAAGSTAVKRFRDIVRTVREARKTLEPPPRLLSRQLFRALPMSCGWLEWDLEDGESPAELIRVAWVDGHAVMVDDSGCESYLDLPIRRYNRPGGFRIWLEKPTEAERMEAAWDD